MKYSVNLYETRFLTVEVDADDPDRAAEQAVDKAIFNTSDVDWSWGDIEILDIEELKEPEDLPLGEL